jgi:sulfonate transport system substrate-binding protein
VLVIRRHTAAADAKQARHEPTIHCQEYTMSIDSTGRRRHLSGLMKALVLSAAAALTAGGAQAQQPIELRIGFQKAASVLVLQRAQGTLERRLAAQNVSIKWVEFPAGPQLLEGLNVGSIDVGYVGEAPPIFAQAAGAQFVYVGNDPARPI